MSKLQEFAKEKFGQELNEDQLKMIEAWTNSYIIIGGRRTGTTFAQNVIQEYVKEAMED